MHAASCPVVSVAVPPRCVLAALAAAMLLTLAGCGGGGDGTASTGTSTGAGLGTSAGTGSGTGTGTGGTGTGSGTTTTTADVVDKYVGTWVQCKANGSTSSSSDSLTITKSTATTVSFSDTHKDFATTNCSGTAGGTSSQAGTATWVGTKMVGSLTVDEINIQPTGQPLQKQIIVIESDGKLYSGVQASDGGTVDANGYPNTLESTGSTKQ